MILYLISCEFGFNSDNGGHAHSLAAIYGAKEGRRSVIVFGDRIQKPLLRMDSVHLFECAPTELVRGREVLGRYPWVGEAKAIHAFDMRSALIGSRIADALGIPLVVTKPGGPRRKMWNARFQNQVVFHAADYEYFASLSFFRPRILALQTGRVATDVPSSHAERLHVAGINIVRIGRICHAYAPVLAQTMALGRELRGRGVQCSVSIIGLVQDAEVLEELEALAGPDDRFYTSDDFTRDAQRYVHQADVVVGTGRGFAESLRAGKPTFFPVGNSTLPCFATHKTIQAGAVENFSPRVTVPESTVAESVDEFSRMVKSPQDIAIYSQWAKAEFSEHYALEGFIPKLARLYDDAKPSTVGFVLMGKIAEVVLLSTRKVKALRRRAGAAH